MKTTELTDGEVRKLGWEALCRELGIVGAARFMRQMERGTGNWTEERRELFKEETVDSIVRSIREEHRDTSG